MQWIKHDCNAHQDAKLKKLMAKHGMQGYGFYFYCLELIGSDISVSNISLALEHDLDVLAYDIRMNADEVKMMLDDMVDVGLLEVNDCFRKL